MNTIFKDVSLRDMAGMLNLEELFSTMRRFGISMIDASSMNGSISELRAECFEMPCGGLMELLARPQTVNLSDLFYNEKRGKLLLEKTKENIQALIEYILLSFINGDSHTMAHNTLEINQKSATLTHKIYFDFCVLSEGGARAYVDRRPMTRAVTIEYDALVKQLQNHTSSFEIAS